MSKEKKTKINIASTIKKPKISRNPRFFDEKYYGVEPEWDTEESLLLEEKDFNTKLISSLNYYNYFYSVKDLKPLLIDWIKQYSADNPEKLEKNLISKFLKVKDNAIPITACSLIRATHKGMPLKETHVNYLLNVIDKSVNIQTDDDTDENVVEKVSQPVIVEQQKPTIQDRLNEIAKDHIGYFIDIEDEVLDYGKNLDPKAFDYLTTKNVSQVILNKIIEPFQQHYNEIIEAKSGQCEQLKEAYKKFKAADYKRIETFYNKLFEGIKQYGDVKKATKKAKVKKPPAKEKLVSKLKYLKNDTVLKLVSINPVDIIGSKELWVYNTKNRKIGRYIADEHSGNALGIKGSIITGYNETTSVAKTLRKPDQQLKEFQNAGKIQLRKYLDSIKTTEVKLNGRINQETILLKIIS